MLEKDLDLTQIKDPYQPSRLPLGTLPKSTLDDSIHPRSKQCRKVIHPADSISIVAGINATSVNLVNGVNVTSTVTNFVDTITSIKQNDCGNCGTDDLKETYFAMKAEDVSCTSDIDCDNANLTGYQCHENSFVVDVAIKETMGIINDCTEQIFLQPAYRLQSVVCYYTLHNWSWFEYCKDCIQRETVPHADILRLQVDFSSSTLINMNASCFPRLTREHSCILLQILAFYSKAYSIIKSTNFQNCTSIYERLKCTFDTLHCSSQLRLAICSCVMQQERSEKMLCKICKKNKEEWKAWIIFSVLDQQVSYQEFHLNSRLVKAQMSTAKRLFPENYKIKIRQKYQFCTSCPSNISMKHDCKHAECLHSAMLGRILLV